MMPDLQPCPIQATGPAYTAVLVNFLPLESVPAVVTVRLLPSTETTMRAANADLLAFPGVATSSRRVCGSVEGAVPVPPR
jgi:hypothetical protein